MNESESNTAGAHSANQASEKAQAVFTRMTMAEDTKCPHCQHIFGEHYSETREASKTFEFAWTCNIGSCECTEPGLKE